MEAEGVDRVNAVVESSLVSIITPVYNTGDVFLETVQSVLNQTLACFEWLLIDDGSTNPITLALLADLCARDARVRVIAHSQNKGLPAARNTGIKKAKGAYLFFLDADDLMDPTFVEKGFLFLEANNEFAFVNSFVKGFGAQTYSWTGGFHDREAFLKENRNTSCFLARRQVFDSVLFDETYTQGCEDWEFWLRAATKGFWGFTIPEYLFYYRRTEDNRWATLAGREAISSIRNVLNTKYGDSLLSKFPSPQTTAFSFGEVAQRIAGATLKPTKKKRLLCLFPWLEIGGADQYNLNLLKGLQKKDWEITIVTTLGHKHPWEEEFKMVSDEIFHLGNLGEEFSYLSILEYLIQSRNPELVFLSNSMFGYYALPSLKQRFPGLPIVDYVHCEDHNWFKGGYPFFSAFYSQLITRTFTTSENLKQWCLERGANGEKTDVCYINVDTNSIQPDSSNREKVRAQLGIGPNEPLILYVARLTAQKQPQVLVNTLEHLAKETSFKCVIIGDGPEKEEMLKQLQQNRLKANIHYVGSKSNEEVLAFMDAADVFFLPSKFEGIALSIFEAMAKGLPIVGAKVGGQAELVTHECGFLINPSTPETEAKEYAAILKSLIINAQQRVTLGAKGRSLVEQSFDLVSMVHQMDSAFREIIENKRTIKISIEQEYEHLLNQMRTLEIENSILKAKFNSRAIRALYKYKKPYSLFKNAFAKVKQII